MLPAIIEWSLIGEVVLVSFLAGIVAVALFALVILGATRAADTRREGQGAAATGYTLLAIVAMLAFLAIGALGIIVMVNK